MRRGAGLFVLGLLCLHSSVLGQAPEEVQPGMLVFCDSPAVDKVASSAVHKFNERLSTGNKLALYQILSAVKSESDTGSVYSLQFTTRRSDCPAGSSKAWTDCDYLSSGHKDPISCNATVQLTETDTDTREVQCQIESYVVPEKAACMGCPKDITDNLEDLKVPLSVSISKYNSISDSAHLFSLNQIGHATREVIAGFRYKLKFDMRKTTCSKALHKDLSGLCVHDAKDVEFAHCNATVDTAPWRHELAQTQIECEPGALPPTGFKRRRPPGWSPLRNLLYDVPSPTLSLPPSAAPVSVKEESSEEDVTAAKPSGLPNVAADPASDSPFHCPSKPWKTFNQVKPAAAGAQTEATPVAVSIDPPADQGFSDADLLM